MTARIHRRDFIRRSLLSCAAGGALFGQFGQMKVLNAAINAAAGGKAHADFKALVCVFLGGGNDSFNTLIPTSGSARTAYTDARGALALPGSDPLLPLTPSVPWSDGCSYALHPGMEGLQQLFQSGQCAVVANVGPLLYPITKNEFQNQLVPVPPQLFSHSDQTTAWQTSWTDSTERTGWGGRLVDAVMAGHANPPLSTCISMDGANKFQIGNAVQPYFMDSDGGQSLFFIEDEWNADRRASFLAIQQIARQQGDSMFLRKHAQVMGQALDNYALVSAALNAGPTLTTTFPDSWLGRQLAMVARLISVRTALGQTRQLYYVTQGGYDTHATQLAGHDEILPDLSASMRAFYDATVELGIQNDVTQFTASDFGRTVSINGDGTDHGWGSHHFVVGGDVLGQRAYGTMPNLTAQGPDDAAWGQIIPTLSVDQYAATLAAWYGVSAGDISSLVVPNLGRFSSPNLGFMAS